MPVWLKSFFLNAAFQLVEAALQVGLLEAKKSLNETDKLDPEQKVLVSSLLDTFIVNFKSELGK